MTDRFLQFSFAILLVAACTQLDRGFEFVGKYRASQSGYEIQIVSRGNIKGGHDISDTAFSFVRICSLLKEGRSFDMTLSFAGDRPIIVESRDLGLRPSNWNWKTSKPILRKLLGQAGFKGVQDKELEDSVKVIEGSLAGPKGSILKGQVESLGVIHVKPDYLNGMRSGRPTISWIDGLPMNSCGL